MGLISSPERTHGAPKTGVAPASRLTPPAGRRPVVVTVRPGAAAALATLGLECEIVEWRRGELPPPGHRADVVLGAAMADESVLPWIEGAMWLHVTGVGVDGLPAWLVTGRTVTNTPGANAVAIAEFAFAAMLAAAKELPGIWNAGPDARWSDFGLDVLYGRILGLVGYGNIGRAVASRARAFGMTVLANRRTAHPDSDGVRFVSKHEVAASADHIVLAAPADAGTRNLVDQAFLDRTRPGVHLVNVARGALVDQDALRPFLDSGHVARATLDTVEPEPLPAGHWLRSHPAVKLSPHVAQSSPNSLHEAVERFAGNFRRYLAGEELHDVVMPR